MFKNGIFWGEIFKEQAMPRLLSFRCLTPIYYMTRIPNPFHKDMPSYNATPQVSLGYHVNQSTQCYHATPGTTFSLQWHKGGLQ